MKWQHDGVSVLSQLNVVKFAITYKTCFVLIDRLLVETEMISLQNHKDPQQSLYFKEFPFICLPL